MFKLPPQKRWELYLSKQKVKHQPVNRYSTHRVKEEREKEGTSSEASPTDPLSQVMQNIAKSLSHSPTFNVFISVAKPVQSAV